MMSRDKNSNKNKSDDASRHSFMSLSEYFTQHNAAAAACSFVVVLPYYVILTSLVITGQLLHWQRCESQNAYAIDRSFT